jgi:hypothetical protein
LAEGAVVLKIVGLVSCFREGELVQAAIKSLAALDHTLVFEGPVEGNLDAAGQPSLLPKPGQRLSVVRGGPWASDAGKRTKMVEWVRKRPWLNDPEGTWGLWLDGDELLLWGDYLRDWLLRVSEQGDEENPVAGWPLPLVELDGTVVICMGKLLRIDLVQRYLASSSYIELVDGSRRTVGNVPYWNVKDGPLLEHWRARPPLQGEPHLLHRPILRSKGRDVERQHAAEARAFAEPEIEALLRRT